MARRKSSKTRRRNGGPFLLLLIGTIVIAVLLFRAAHAPEKPAPQRVAQPQATVSSTPAPAEQTPRPSPTGAPTAAPSLAPLQSASPSSAPSAAGEHRLAIIIDDCGQWPVTERALIALPIAITMSVMPKERYTKTIAAEADAAGKGVMLHLPMEPLAAIDPGPGKITTAMSDDAIVAQVKDDVALVPLAKGVNNHEGSKASADPRVMKDVASVLGPAGLFFIDSRTSAQSVGAQVAGAAGVRTASRDVFLDNRDNVEAVETMLREAASLALRSGSAIAIGHPRTATLEAIRSLIPELQAKGITFVRASDLVR